MVPPDDLTLVTWSQSVQCNPLYPPVDIQPIPCFMYSSTTSKYNQQFPALERRMDPITSRTSKLFVNPNKVQPGGKLKPLTQAEEVMNWKSENMVAQNDILQNLDRKVDKIVEKVEVADDISRISLRKCKSIT